MPRYRTYWDGGTWREYGPPIYSLEEARRDGLNYATHDIQPTAQEVARAKYLDRQGRLGLDAHSLRIKALNQALDKVADLITQKLAVVANFYEIKMSQVEIKTRVASKLQKDRVWYQQVSNPTFERFEDIFFDGIHRCYSDRSNDLMLAQAKWLVEGDDELTRQLENHLHRSGLLELRLTIERSAVKSREHERLWLEGRDYAYAQQLAGHLTPPDSEETIASWTPAGQQGYRAQWDAYLEQLASIEPDEIEPTNPTSELIDSSTEIPDEIVWQGRSRFEIPGRYLERFSTQTIEPIARELSPISTGPSTK